MGQEDARKVKQRFLELFEPLRGDLSDYFILYTGDRAMAEDLVHETSVRLYEHMVNAEQEPKNFRAYTFGVAYFAYIDMRYRGNRKEHVENISAEELISRYLPPDAHANVESIRTAIEQMPLHHREILVPLVFKESTSPEIAEELEITPASAKARSWKSKKVLRNLFRRDRAIEGDHPPRLGSQPPTGNTANDDTKFNPFDGVDDGSAEPIV